MMRQQKGAPEMGVEMPEWLQLRWPEFDLLIGFEEDDEGDEEEEEESEEEESEEEEEEEESEEDEGKSKKAARAEAEKATAKLKSALRKERQSRRALAKELREVKAKLPPEDKEKEDKDKGDKGKADEELARFRAEQHAREEKDRQKSEKLAAKLQVNAVDTTIIRVLQGAKMPKFRDTDDVLHLINRKEIDVEQDTDDPTDIEVDEDDVRDAIKALAKSKPHLLAEKAKEGDGRERSGSSFGGRTRKSKESDNAALQKKFPALTRRT